MQAALAVERTARWPGNWSSEAMQRAAIFAVSLVCALVVWSLLA